MTRSDDATRNDRASKDAGFVARRRGRRRSLGPCARARAGVAREHVARGGECASVAQHPRTEKKPGFSFAPAGIVRVPVQKKWWLHHGDYFLSVSFQSVKGAFQKSVTTAYNDAPRPPGALARSGSSPSARSVRTPRRAFFREECIVIVRIPLAATFAPSDRARVFRSRVALDARACPAGLREGKKTLTPSPRPRPILRPPSLARSSEDDEPRPGRVSGPPP